MSFTHLILLIDANLQMMTWQEILGRCISAEMYLPNPILLAGERRYKSNRFLYPNAALHLYERGRGRRRRERQGRGKGEGEGVSVLVMSEMEVDNGGLKQYVLNGDDEGLEGVEDV